MRPHSFPKGPLTLLLTGSAGFIGQSCLRWLRTKYPTSFIQGVDRVSEVGRFFQSDHFSLALETWKPVKRPDLILHLGAITDTSCQDLEALRQWNVESSKHYWSMACELQVPFIYASSAATYGQGKEGFSDKTSILQPTNPYGASKYAFDQWVLTQARTPPRWMGWKFFNVFGDLEQHKGPMKSFVFKGLQELENKGTLTLFRSHHPDIQDGQQARDFVWVEDVMDVMFKALYFKDLPSGIYNLGTGRARSFLSLAEDLMYLIPGKLQWIDTPSVYQSHYQYHTQADLSTWSHYGFHHTFSEPLPALSAIKKHLDYLTNLPETPTLPKNGIPRAQREGIYG